MDKKILQIFVIFWVLFKTHIRTKTTDRLFHTDSPEFYQFAFDAFHKIYERAIDLWILPNLDGDKAKSQTMDSLVELQTIIESMIKDKQTTGMDNLLRGLADELEDKIWNMKSFICDVEEEKKEETTPETKKDSPFTK